MACLRQPCQRRCHAPINCMFSSSIVFVNHVGCDSTNGYAARNKLPAGFARYCFRWEKDIWVMRSAIGRYLLLSCEGASLTRPASEKQSRLPALALSRTSSSNPKHALTYVVVLSSTPRNTFSYITRPRLVVVTSKITPAVYMSRTTSSGLVRRARPEWR